MLKIPLLTIKQVRIISAVASHASLARASEELSASQSSLSRSIADVEKRLQHRLFARGWSGMEPTSQGEVVIAHCRRMMSSMATAQDTLRATGARVGDLSHHLAWDLLSAVSAVRATGSVSAAAAYLGLSQPDVSRALAKANAAIGRPAFERTRSGMKATADAAVLDELHSRLRMDVMVLPQQLEALTGQITGRVAIGLLPFSRQDVVTQAFGEMLRRHRHVRLQAVTGSYAALIDGLRQGELDFIIGPLRSPAPDDALTEQHLYDEFFAVVARTGHRLATGAPDWAELAHENWVVAPHGTPTRRYFEQILISQGLTPPAQTCEMVTFFLAEQMVLNSDTIGLLTYARGKLDALRNGLKPLAVELPGNRIAIGLTYRNGQGFTPAQAVFVKIMAAIQDRRDD